MPSYRSKASNRVSSPPLYIMCLALVDSPIHLPSSFVVKIKPCAGLAVFFFKKSPISLYIRFNSSSSVESGLKNHINITNKFFMIVLT